jgi:phage terminase Nu1 subunit (DNA packaging protein)
MGQKAAAAKPKRQTYWLTHDGMAKACGISVQAFRMWGVPSVAKIGRNAFYLVSDVLANRLQRQAAKQQQTAEPATDLELTRSEREEKLRLTKAQAEGQELKNAQLRKELAPVDVIEWVIGKAGGQISAILDALPSQLKKRNPKLTASNIETIRREIVKAQNAASQMTVDLDEYYERNESPDR